MLTPEHLTHLAFLARLNPTSEMLSLFNEQYTAILNHMDILASVDTSKIPPLYSPIENSTENIRNDIPITNPDHENIFTNAPETNGEFFIVPRIV